MKLARESFFMGYLIGHSIVWFALDYRLLVSFRDDSLSTNYLIFDLQCSSLINFFTALIGNTLPITPVLDDMAYYLGPLTTDKGEIIPYNENSVAALLFIINIFSQMALRYAASVYYNEPIFNLAHARTSNFEFEFYFMTTVFQTFTFVFTCLLLFVATIKHISHNHQKPVLSTHILY